MTDYPGEIFRNDLVAFCQNQELEIRHDLEVLDAAMDNTHPEDLMGITEFGIAAAERRGRVLALRDVCEWAKAKVGR